MKRNLALLSIIGITLFGCSTDFDLTAPYKETIVVDGLLNEVDSIQYIKVSKAFLGDGNALIMAQQKDSINYANVLSVKLKELSSGLVFNLTRVESNDKDTGVFYSPFHVLYKTDPFQINSNSLYEVEVTNSETGVVASSKTKIVGDVLPSNINDPLNIATPFTSPLNIRFSPGKNAVFYSMVIRFHYRELDPSGNSTEHSIQWDLGTPKSIQPSEIIYSFVPRDLYRFIGENIPDKAGYTRRIDSLSPGVKPLEFVIMEGSEDLQTYINLQKPASGIVQERPVFTTVENGLGLFSSRIIHPIFRSITQSSEIALDTNIYTSSKNFEF